MTLASQEQNPQSSGSLQDYPEGEIGALKNDGLRMYHTWTRTAWV